MAGLGSRGPDCSTPWRWANRPCWVLSAGTRACSQVTVATAKQALLAADTLEAVEQRGLIHYWSGWIPPLPLVPMTPGWAIGPNTPASLLSPRHSTGGRAARLDLLLEWVDPASPLDPCDPCWADRPKHSSGRAEGTGLRHLVAMGAAIFVTGLANSLTSISHQASTGAADQPHLSNQAPLIGPETLTGIETDQSEPNLGECHGRSMLNISLRLYHKTGIEAQANSQGTGVKGAISHHKADLCIFWCVEVIAKEGQNLKELYLVSCKITDYALIAIGRYSMTIETVDVGWCKEITDQGATLIAQSSKSLRYLGLMRCDKSCRQDGESAPPSTNSIPLPPSAAGTVGHEAVVVTGAGLSPSSMPPPGPSHHGSWSPLCWQPCSCRCCSHVLALTALASLAPADGMERLEPEPAVVASGASAVSGCEWWLLALIAHQELGEVEKP
ncbi:F-box/LRR-repeat protein 17 [Myotis davidii]|uniref:F-box/LRR-repeat protein 17 n=1 Tax=Myotis davidii TaxID=225400 RepID=L5MFB1_MYODS|nr:F-box/LRR-repeat protein 17 [Myotis davidii]